ncbi:hypothetical protein N7462_000806 [Penicillium macrosclerotiorum]|uniref:uncharacterized protein n=1 Tax=Penicillium macrosclerotiorum TaxID=303699 RepID=UPI002548E30B|nr:uncharacterized protein N7462_000806 [Penicillium macrosclerotiorum]KAJ5698801.1 hypothetical protein N7462_000806 [Penicillium macrosclerotiorum]
MLRKRMELLERVLESHGIDVEASIAQLLTESDSPNQPGDGNCPCSSSNMEDLCGTFDGALTLDESLNFDQDGEVRYFGPTSGRLLFRSPMNDSPSEEAIQIDALCTSYYSDSFKPFSATFEDAGALNGSQDLTEHHSISNDLQAHLIDLYFEWEQPWLQVVNEKLFRESLICGGRYSSPLLLNCILALGSRYCDRIEVRTDPADSNTAGRGFLDVAERLIQNDLRWPKITTIQALTIMGMVYIAMGSDAAGWLHHGMANRLALDMGFNMDPAVLAGAVALPAIEIELRRQIYWALYCHDKLSASYTGRVCTLLDSQGAVNKPDLQCASNVHLPSANGQLRAASQGDVVQLHRAMIDLCRILEKILHSLWSPKPLLHMQKRSIFFDLCILELKTWYYDLPSELKIERASGPSKFAHAYTLYMVYHTAYILLCGPFLMNNTPNNVCSTATTDQTQESDEKSTEHDRTQPALANCSASVRAMIIVAQKYRQTFGSFKLSPITATHCVLSAALIIIERCCSLENYSKSIPEEESTRTLSPHAAAGLCFQVLRELSTSWNIAKRIGRNLEKVYCERYGDHLPSPPENYDPPPCSKPCPPLDPFPSSNMTGPPLEPFNEFFDPKNMVFEAQLSRNLENSIVGHAGANINLPDIQTFDGVDPNALHNFPYAGDLFGNNHGYAFSPDCLPSDYNIFDTLNQINLEEFL